MKAIIHHKFGKPSELELVEMEKPTPKADEVLIKIMASTVTAGDCELRSMSLPFPFNLPMRLMLNKRFPNGKILGQEFAGIVEAVGEKVIGFEPGQRVFGTPLMRFGCYAEYLSLPSSYPLLPIPNSLKYEDVATIPTGGLNALHFTRMANVKEGDQLLVNGAGGSIGTYCIQLAKQKGAIITAVDSAEKLNGLKELGAHNVYDYQKGAFWEKPNQYDAIIDIVGTAGLKGLRSVRKNGRYIMGNPRFSLLPSAAFRNALGSKKIIFKLADYTKPDMQLLLNEMAEGRIKAVIEQRMNLEEIRDAHIYVESGKKFGNLIINNAGDI